MRLERRIMLIIALIILLPGVAANSARLILNSRDRLQYETAQHENRALLAINQSVPTPRRNAQTLLDYFVGQPNTFRVEVINPDGRIVTSNRPDRSNLLSSDQREVAQVVQLNQPVSRLIVLNRLATGKDPTLTTTDYLTLVPFRERIAQDLWLPVIDDRDNRVIVVVYLRLTFDNATTAMRLQAISEYGVTIISLALISLILRLALVRWVERPLANLGIVAARIAAGDRSARAPTGPDDAIGRLAQEFNAMTEALVHTEREADSDPVIGLLNHRALRRRLEQEVAHASTHKRRLTVLMLDLDGFKGVNDTWGHQAGDQVLLAVGAIIRQQVRRTDIVGRYGGDEFMVILPETSPILAKELAVRIRATIRQLFLPEITPRLLPIDVSIGCAAYPDDGTRASDLIAHADAALYAQKSARKQPLSGSVR